MYTTALQLLAVLGATELAQVATPEQYPVVTPELLTLVINAGDTSAELPADVAVAVEAVARITRAIADADEMIDGYLAGRYPLPLAIVPGILQTYASDIVRYRLHKDFPEQGQHPVQVRYRDALRFLTLLADGKVTLGAQDPAPPTSGNRVQYSAPARVFDAPSLADY